MERLEFEQIKTNIAMDLWRLKVPGGWLVSSSDDVMTNNPNNGCFGTGYEWRTSLCFIPDPEYKWLPDQQVKGVVTLDTVYHLIKQSNGLSVREVTNTLNLDVDLALDYLLYLTRAGKVIQDENGNFKVRG